MNIATSQEPDFGCSQFRRKTGKAKAGNKNVTLMRFDSSEKVTRQSTKSICGGPEKDRGSIHSVAARNCIGYSMDMQRTQVVWSEPSKSPAQAW